MTKYSKPQLAARAKAQRAYYARLREGGKTEVRNLFAKPEHHDQIKSLARAVICKKWAESLNE